MKYKNVMVTSSLVSPVFAACTRMACLDENPCCNSCHADPSFGHVYLIDPDGNRFGCQGTLCDWEDNCYHSSSDIVTITRLKSQGKIIFLLELLGLLAQTTY